VLPLLLGASAVDVDTPLRSEVERPPPATTIWCTLRSLRASAPRRLTWTSSRDEMLSGLCG